MGTLFTIAALAAVGAYFLFPQVRTPVNAAFASAVAYVKGLLAKKEG